MTDQQIAQLRQLSQWLAATDIACLELSGPGHTVRLRRQGSHAAVQLADAAPGPAPSAAAVTVVRAHSVGVLLHAHPCRPQPLVQAGEQVVQGQPVALLQVGLVLLAVPAPRAGTVVSVLGTHGAAVGWGEPLVEIA